MPRHFGAVVPLSFDAPARARVSLWSLVSSRSSPPSRALSRPRVRVADQLVSTVNCKVIVYQD